MSIRTSEAEVEAVLGFTVDSGTLDTHITNASLWVDNYLEGQTCVDSDKLLPIETYLAAHLYISRQSPGSTGAVVARTRADISERYADGGGSGRVGKTFAEIAAAFDACGIVAAHWLDKPRFRFRVGAGYDPRHTGRTG